MLLIIQTSPVQSFGRLTFTSTIVKLKLHHNKSPVSYCIFKKLRSEECLLKTRVKLARLSYSTI